MGRLFVDYLWMVARSVSETLRTVETPAVLCLFVLAVVLLPP